MEKLNTLRHIMSSKLRKKEKNFKGKEMSSVEKSMRPKRNSKGCKIHI